jgi:hypothetical protein
MRREHTDYLAAQAQESKRIYRCHSCQHVLCQNCARGLWRDARPCDVDAILPDNFSQRFCGLTQLRYLRPFCCTPVLVHHDLCDCVPTFHYSSTVGIPCHRSLCDLALWRIPRQLRELAPVLRELVFCGNRLLDTPRWLSEVLTLHFHTVFDCREYPRHKACSVAERVCVPADDCTGSAGLLWVCWYGWSSTRPTAEPAPTAATAEHASL